MCFGTIWFLKFSYASIQMSSSWVSETHSLPIKALNLTQKANHRSLLFSWYTLSWNLANWDYWFFNWSISSVQSLSWVQLFVTPWTAAHQASLSIINSQSLLRLLSIQSVMPSNHLILCHPLLLLSSIFPSTRVFSNESVLHFGWPKYWSFSFNISPANEYSGLISFRIDCFDLLEYKGFSRVFSNTTVQKASILQCFLYVQLSHPYMTTGKTTALTRWTLVAKQCFWVLYAV